MPLNTPRSSAWQKIINIAVCVLVLLSVAQLILVDNHVNLDNHDNLDNLDNLDNYDAFKSRALDFEIYSNMLDDLGLRFEQVIDRSLRPVHMLEGDYDRKEFLGRLITGRESLHAAAWGGARSGMLRLDSCAVNDFYVIRGWIFVAKEKLKRGRGGSADWDAESHFRRLFTLIERIDECSMASESKEWVVQTLLTF